VNQPYAFISSTLTFWAPVFVMLVIYRRIYKEALRQKEAIRCPLDVSLSRPQELSGRCVSWMCILDMYPGYASWICKYPGVMA
jgi:hypothetical protein